MAFSAGMYFENGAGNTVFAEHPNAMLNAQRGNYVVNTAGNGGAVTANGTSDLTTTTADIDIADVDVFNNGSITSLSGITSIDLSEAYDDLAAGQSLYVLIYIKANGVISNPTDAGGSEGVGTAATTGQQLPPAIPENSVPLALITLTNGDTTVDAADIEDYRIEGPQGGYVNGSFRVVSGSIIAFDTDGTTGAIGIGNSVDSNIGVFVDSPALSINANQSYDRFRVDDQGALTVTTGTTSPLVTTAHFEEPNIILAGTGAVTRATTMYIANAPTEGSSNYAFLIDSGLSEIRDLDMYAPNQVRIYDPDASDALLFDFDTTNRTFDIGNASDSILTNFWGNIDLNGNDITKVYDILANGDTSRVVLSGGSTSGSGANIVLYGTSEASTPNDIRIRQGTTNILQYDHSATKWIAGVNLDLNGNDINNVDQINASGTYINLNDPSATRTIIPLVDSSYDLGNGSRYWREIFYDTLTASSSKERKKNISYDVDYMSDILYELKPVTYQRKDSIHGRFGFILEDIEKMSKEDDRFRYFLSYSEEDEEYKNANGLNIDAFIPSIVLAIQNLNDRISKLEQVILEN